MPKGRSKSFADSLRERLDKTETRRLEEASKLEIEFLESLKKEISETVTNYMAEKGVGFRQMARMICCSEAQFARITSGKCGFTMFTIAHIGAALGLKPDIVFKQIEKSKAQPTG